MDSPSMRASVESMLLQLGFQVVVSESDSCARAAPLAFVCDLLHVAKVRDRNPSANIIALVEQPTLEQRILAYRAGCRITIPADVDASDLATAIERLAPPDIDKPRILLVDDDLLLAEHIASVLRRAHLETAVLSDPTLLLEVVSEVRPHLVLMDMRLPNCTGLELAAVLRQDDRMAGVPIVFLTAEDEPARALEALEIGADDFLTKPVEEQHLISVVQSRLARSRVLRSFMDRDSLTRLLSHARTLERLEEEVALETRRAQVVSLAIIDLDHFKRVNDSYGHATGDRVLRSLAMLLRRQARRGDIVGRCGGEEFALILPGAKGQDALRTIDHRRQMFGKLSCSSPRGVVSVTFSAGVATLMAGETPGELWERADVALYEAKREGRNRVVLSTNRGNSRNVI